MQFNTCCLVEVDVDSLQLEVGVAVVGASWVNSVLIGDHLPELEIQNNSWIVVVLKQCGSYPNCKIMLKIILNLKLMYWVPIKCTKMDIIELYTNSINEKESVG